MYDCCDSHTACCWWLESSQFKRLGKPKRPRCWVANSQQLSQRWNCQHMSTVTDELECTNTSCCSRMCWSETAAHCCSNATITWWRRGARPLFLLPYMQVQIQTVRWAHGAYPQLRCCSKKVAHVMLTVRWCNLYQLLFWQVASGGIHLRWFCLCSNTYCKNHVHVHHSIKHMIERAFVHLQAGK